MIVDLFEVNIFVLSPLRNDNTLLIDHIEPMVERWGEYDMLKKLDVDYAQGYLFGRPSEKPTPIDKPFFS